MITQRIQFFRTQKFPLQYQSPLQQSRTSYSWLRLPVILTQWLEEHGLERDVACRQATGINWINNKWVNQKREVCIPRICSSRIVCKTLRSEWADQFLMNNSSSYLFSNQLYWKYRVKRTSITEARTLFCFVMKDKSVFPEEFIITTYLRWSQKY